MLELIENLSLEKFIEKIESNGPDLEIIIHYLKTSKLLVESNELLQNVLIELETGTQLFEIESAEEWILLQNKILYLLGFIINMNR